MDKPFQYDKYATGKDFIGRRKESITIESMLRSNQNVLLYDAPKTGKGSLIRHALYDLKISSYPFIAGHISLACIRSRDTFLREYASTLLKSAAADDGEAEDLAGEYLSDTDFEAAALSLPEKLALHFSVPVIVIIEQFQNFMLFDDWEDMLETLEIAWSGRERATYVLSGSKINAMKDIFENRKHFYRFAEYVPLEPIDEKEITEYIIRGFSKGGKIIERDLCLGIARLFESNCWYINQFLSICDSLSRGFINEGILVEALEMLVSAHSLRFREAADGMTGFQINMLRAILDGTVKLSSSDTIEKYGLNSSANVRRLKDALEKKEIVVFDGDDVPRIIDPLFKYWVKKYYFAIQ